MSLTPHSTEELLEEIVERVELEPEPSGDDPYSELEVAQFEVDGKMVLVVDGYEESHIDGEMGFFELYDRLGSVCLAYQGSDDDE